MTTNQNENVDPAELAEQLLETGDVEIPWEDGDDPLRTYRAVMDEYQKKADLPPSRPFTEEEQRTYKGTFAGLLFAIDLAKRKEDGWWVAAKATTKKHGLITYVFVIYHR